MTVSMTVQPAPKRPAIWNLVHHDGQRLLRIGHNTDGTLYNPHGYPEELVRAALGAAEERLQQRRRDSAKQAAETRRERLEKRVYQAAQRIVEGHVFGPARKCQICGRGVVDPDSIERGIGSDCWPRVLQHISRRSTPGRGRD